MGTHLASTVQKQQKDALASKAAEQRRTRSVEEAAEAAREAQQEMLREQISKSLERNGSNMQDY